MGFYELKKIFSDLRLKPVSTRELSLFTLSCVAKAYTDELKKILGFGYSAVGALGKNNFWQSFYDENLIAIKTEKLLKENPKRLVGALKSANKLYKKSQILSSQAKKLLRTNPEKALFLLIDAQIMYMTGIGVYNCFWHLSAIKDLKKLPKRFSLNTISKNRQKIAQIYPNTERLLHECWNKIEKNKKLPKFSMCNLSFIETKRLFFSNKKNRSNLRKLGYFYLFKGEKSPEFISTQPKILKWARSLTENKNHIRELRGICAFSGKITNKALLLNSNIKKLPKNGFILVASTTHPKDIKIIKKASAIVADEGGILSHAGIISRELKIPCIVGTKIATKIFKNGDMVNFNATKGIIEKI